jgi:UDP-glucose 4-epimerase
MRVLITGGAGFIGSQVADAHAARGDEVIVVDSLVGGSRDFLTRGARFHQMDIRDPALREVLVRERPQVVNHHAAQVSVSASVKDPLFDADVNLLGTLRLLEHCVAAGVQQLIFASTGGALYGDPETLPADESTPIRPLSPYAAGKYAAETYIGMFQRTHGIRACCLRYANVYGPRQDPHGEAGVVAIFSRALLDGRPATLFDDGEQTRDFVYVDDVVRANLIATDRRADGAINIGTGIATTVNTVYAVLARAAGVSAPARHVAPRPGDVRHITLAAGRARARLGWEPATNVEAGLTATIEWFRGRPS